MTKRLGNESVSVRKNGRQWQVTRRFKGRSYCARIYDTRRQAAAAYLAWL